MNVSVGMHSRLKLAMLLLLATGSQCIHAADWPIYAAGAEVALPAGVTFPDESPLPGLAVNPTIPEAHTSGSYQFKLPGIYYWKSATADGIVLIRSASRLGNADMVIKLVSAAATGANNADAKYYASPDGEALDLLLHPGLRDWACGPTSGIADVILSRFDIPARTVQWLGPNQIEGHQTLEVDLGEDGGWTLYDPHFGNAYALGVTGLEIWHRVNAGQDIASMLRHYDPQTPWQITPPPWEVYLEYNFAFGLWEASPGEVVMVAKPEVQAPQLSERLGGMPVRVVTESEMVDNYYH
ncbi:MAG: hypothetical protein H6978_03930 [Gammaproteobacteria bacterium]|nr:hypothetical protein [Gammaproteobacteria bacterium]